VPESWFPQAAWFTGSIIGKNEGGVAASRASDTLSWMATVLGSGAFLSFYGGRIRDNWAVSMRKLDVVKHVLFTALTHVAIAARDDVLHVQGRLPTYTGTENAEPFGVVYRDVDLHGLV
jgi:hypothetical protein